MEIALLVLLTITAATLTQALPLGLRSADGAPVTSDDLESKVEQEVKAPTIHIFDVLTNRRAIRPRARRTAQGGCHLGTCQMHNLANTLYQIGKTSDRERSKDTHDPQGYGR